MKQLTIKDRDGDRLTLSSPKRSRCAYMATQWDEITLYKENIPEIIEWLQAVHKERKESVK